jgi:flagellar biosynthesis protein FlhA
MLNDAIAQSGQMTVAQLEPRIAQQMLESTAQVMEEMATKGFTPLVLSSASIRLAFKRLTERALPSLAVLSYNEIASGVNVTAEGMVDLQSNQAEVVS